MNAIFLVFPVLLPILFGAVLPLFHFQKKQQRELYVMAVVILNTLLTYYLIFRMPAEAVYGILFNKESDGIVSDGRAFQSVCRAGGRSVAVCHALCL